MTSNKKEDTTSRIEKNVVNSSTTNMDKRGSMRCGHLRTLRHTCKKELQKINPKP